MRLPGIDIHSDFEWQPALRFIGTPFAANRIRYCNGRNLSQSEAKNAKWTDQFFRRILSIAFPRASSSIGDLGCSVTDWRLWLARSMFLIGAGRPMRRPQRWAFLVLQNYRVLPAPTEQLSSRLRP
jgi:hypothetical protein